MPTVPSAVTVRPAERGFDFLDGRLRFLTDRDEKGAMEVIWGNRLQTGDFKYPRSFPHFVADAGDERVGHWLDERIDLARVYAEIWKCGTGPPGRCRRVLRQR